MNRKLPYQLAAVGVSGILKIWYVGADNGALAFLLRPTDALVGLTTNSSSLYLPDAGYFHSELSILIDKSCAGFNFWILCFLMLSFLALGYLNRRSHLAATLPITLLCTYVLTIFTNTSRISIAIFLQKKRVLSFLITRDGSTRRRGFSCTFPA